MNKKSVYHRPVTIDQLSAKNTLQQAILNRDKLIRRWGEEVYIQHIKSLEDHIKLSK